MTRLGPRGERWLVCGLLVLCAGCCLGVAQATAALEAANATRRSQLSLLTDLVGAVDRLAPGPVAELDGLFAHRLAVVPTRYGAVLSFVFAADAAEGKR